MMLMFRQAEKAVQKGDTRAFDAVMDRAFGKPKQDVNATVKADVNLSNQQINFE